METPAVEDLDEILSYITYILKEPVIAKRIYTSIKAKVKTLELMPNRHAIVDEERYWKLGIRKLPIGNYTAFYSVDESTKTVRVLRILYNRRNWKQLL
jgi:toxin ParE1/3/4